MSEWLNKHLSYFSWGIVILTLCSIPFVLIKNYWFNIAMISAMVVTVAVHLIASKVKKVNLIAAVLWAGCAAFWIYTLPPRP